MADIPQNEDVTVLDEFLPPKPIKLKGRDGQTREYLVCESDGNEKFWDWLARLSDLQQRAAKENQTPTERAATGYEMMKLQAELIEQCVLYQGQKVLTADALRWGKEARTEVFRLCMSQNGFGKESADLEGKDFGDAATSGGGSASPNGSAVPSDVPAGSCPAANSSSGS